MTSPPPDQPEQPAQSGQSGQSGQSAEPATEGDFVQSYRWMDTHGQVRSLSIYAEPVPDARVWAYADGGDLVAAVTSEGKFIRRAGADVAYGLDTAAAWNDLIEVCRQAHTAHNVWRPGSL